MAHLVIVGSIVHRADCRGLAAVAAADTPWTAAADLPVTRVAAPVAQMRGLLLELTR